MRLSQRLLPDMELLKKLFPKILNMKNANKIKDRMTQFNMSVAVKRRRDHNSSSLLSLSVFNPLMNNNVPKWSDTLLKYCNIWCKILKMCLTVLGHYAIKGLI